MKRSETTNTFSDGLVMDVSPLVTPNNVMCNALNATLLTFNGNEYVLQNDMGNGRVETAYLPQGYVPIGTASLGGIIYIVSYNPLENKCQIGCFPSPERNIASEEVAQTTNILSNDQFVDGQGNIKSALIKINLLDKKLNPGDKYIVYTTNNCLESNKDSITDYGSTTNVIGDLPKLLRLHLVSIDTENKITYLDSSLKWYSNNYFIPNLEEQSGVPNLDEYRSLTSSAYNIFNSKVSGKLCILAELETIDSFSCTWDAVILNNDEENKSSLIKFITSWNSNNLDYINPKYVILTECDYNGVSKTVEENYGYEITQEDINNNKNNQETKIDVGTFVYDPNSLNQTTLNYEVTPAMSFGKLTYLATRGIINFSELGSGKIELSEWRYFVQDNSFLLSWGLVAYPEINKEIAGVEFKFIPYDVDINNTSKIATYSISGRQSYSGNFTETINLDNTQGSYKLDEVIWKNKLYLVQITVKYRRKGSEDDSEYKYYTRWLYTTPIFNQSYLDSTITDFDSLQPQLKLSSKMVVDNQIKSTNIDNYFPILIRDMSGVDTDVESTLGAYIQLVNQDDSEPNNVKVTIDTQLDNNWNLFDIDRSKLIYQNTIGNKEISVTDYQQVSENPTYLDQDFMKVLYDTPEELEVSTGSLYQKYNTEGYRLWDKNTETQNYDNWKNYKDTFKVTPESGYESKASFGLTYKGVLYNKISAQLHVADTTVENVLAPFIYNQFTASSYNMTYKDGNFYTNSYIYLGASNSKGHKARCSSGTLTLAGNTATSTNKNNWNTGHEKATVSILDSNIQWLCSKSSEEIAGTFIPCIIGYYYKGDKGNNDAKYAVKSPGPVNSSWPFRIPSDQNRITDTLKSIGEIWNIAYNPTVYLMIKSQAGLLLPINMYAVMDKDEHTLVVYYGTKHTFADYIYQFLCQLYRIYKSSGTVPKFAVQYINYISKYTESWNVGVSSTISMPEDTLNNILTLGSNNIPLSDVSLSRLYAYTQASKMTASATLNNVKPIIENTSISDTIKINFNLQYPLLEQYLNKKELSYGTMIIYTDGSVDYIENTKSTNSIYYLDDNKQFQTLNRQFVPKRVQSVTINDNQIFCAKLSSTSATSNIDYSKYLKYDSNNESLTVGDSAWKSDSSRFSMRFVSNDDDPYISEYRSTFTLDDQFKI